MLMLLSGAHAPCFTRNLVILTDSAGHQGISEIHGEDYTHGRRVAMKELVAGMPVVKYREVMQRIHKAFDPHSDEAPEGIQTLDITKLKYVVRSEWAIECVMAGSVGAVSGSVHVPVSGTRPATEGNGLGRAGRCHRHAVPDPVMEVR